MTTILTFVVLFAFAVAFPLWSTLSFPAFIRDLRAGKPDILVRGYKEMLAVQWSLTITLLACWASDGRPWSELGLGAPGLGGFIGFAAAAALAVLGVQQHRAMRAAPAQTREQLRRQLGDTVQVLPRNPRELGWFAAVAMTAGFCEEVVYRGALPFFLAMLVPGWCAIAIVTLAFGLAHAYQGPSGVAKVTIVGGVYAGVVLATGSLWTAIILHVLIDLHGGGAAYAVAKSSAD